MSGPFVVGENPSCEGCGGYVTHTLELGESYALLCEVCAFVAEDALIANGRRDYRLIWLGIEEGE